ncbi:ABC transporter permease subunit [Actinophytocola sp.]|uniref:ABC transporter permease subunit n=1 Tax=Actinophytocola sp. TaxID=1872138 RepID=UPI002ED1E524
MSVLVPALRAEWTKARTVRSTWWSLATTAILSVGLAVLLGFQMAGLPPERRADMDLAQLSFLSLLIGQIALVVFGVLLVSAEYTSGTVRASLAAVPRRGVFLAAKTLVAVGVAGVVGVAVAFGTFFATNWALGGHGTTLGEPGVLRAVLGASAYLAMMCVFAMGVATVLRSSALALGILIPLLFLNSQGLASLPAIRSVTQYLPDQAGAGMMRIAPDEVFFLGELDFGPGVAFLIMLAWVVAALVGGYLSLRGRDA